ETCTYEGGASDVNIFLFANTVGLCGYEVAGTELDPTFDDNCPDASISHNYGAWANPSSLGGANFPVGSTVVIWTVTDASGNTTQCTIEIIVEDTELPTFVNCPEAVTFTIGADADCENGVIWSIPIADDNCPGVIVTQTDGPAQGEPLIPGTY